MVNVIGSATLDFLQLWWWPRMVLKLSALIITKNSLQLLNAGKTTFKEDGLDELFNDAVKAGIKFTTEYQKTDMYIVSVPTLMTSSQRRLTHAML